MVVPGDAVRPEPTKQTMTTTAMAAVDAVETLRLSEAVTAEGVSTVEEVDDRWADAVDRQ